MKITVKPFKMWNNPPSGVEIIWCFDQVNSVFPQYFHSRSWNITIIFFYPEYDSASVSDSRTGWHLCSNSGLNTAFDFVLFFSDFPLVSKHFSVLCWQKTSISEVRGAPRVNFREKRGAPAAQKCKDGLQKLSFAPSAGEQQHSSDFHLTFITMILFISGKGGGLCCA